jgi:hypothetical protein
LSRRGIIHRIKEEKMSKLDNIEPETMLATAVDKIRSLRWLTRKVSADLAQVSEELEEFLETYDGWDNDREPGDVKN